MEAHGKGTWWNPCGANELCSTAWRDEYVTSAPLRIALATTQSDEIAPYVEVYVDDGLRAEGEVREKRVFEVPAPRGVHRVELRLVNGYTRNGTQRRVGIGQ